MTNQEMIDYISLSVNQNVTNEKIVEEINKNKEALIFILEKLNNRNF